MDKTIQKEFPNFKFGSIEQVQKYLAKRIDEESNLDFLKIIRMSNREHDRYDDSNSILIGFISLHPVGMADQFFAGGIKNNLSFGLSSEYQSKGIMVVALTQLLNSMLKDGYNIAPCIVKNNIASERVLLKCGFKMVMDNGMNKLYVRRLDMDEAKFNKVFEI